jgi:hypothetical protein
MRIRWCDNWDIIQCAVDEVEREVGGYGGEGD